MTRPDNPAAEIGRLAARIIEIAPAAELYVEIKIRHSDALLLARKGDGE